MGFGKKGGLSLLQLLFLVLLLAHVNFVVIRRCNDVDHRILMGPDNGCLGLRVLLRLLLLRVKMLLLGELTSRRFLLTTTGFVHLLQLQGQTGESNLHFTLLHLIRTCFHQRNIILAMDRRSFTAVRELVGQSIFEVLGSGGFQLLQFHLLVILQNELLKLLDAIIVVPVIRTLVSFHDIFLSGFLSDLLGDSSLMMLALHLGLLERLDVPFDGRF